MPLVLAIESDPRQAAALTRVVRDRVGAELLVVDTKDAAIASIKRRRPDLILLTALCSPRDEEDLVAHLRTLEGAEHLQTITIPQLASGRRSEDTSKRGLFGFKKKSSASETQGCDPSVFAEQIAGYLKTAAELKAAAEAQAQYAARAAEITPLAVDPADSAPAPLSDFAFEPPAERPSDATFAQMDEAAGPSDRAASPPDGAASLSGRPMPELEPESKPARAPLIGFTARTLGELLEKEQAALSGGSDEMAAASSIERSAIGPSSIEPSAIDSSAISIDPSPMGSSVRADSTPARRLPPLAIWARMPASASQASDAAPAATAFDVSELLRALRVPGPVATIAYARGCRIRRVTTGGAAQVSP